MPLGACLSKQCRLYNLLYFIGNHRKNNVVASPQPSYQGRASFSYGSVKAVRVRFCKHAQSTTVAG